MRMPIVALTLIGSLVFLASCGAAGGYPASTSSANSAPSAAALATQTGASPSYSGSDNEYPNGSSATPAAANSGSSAQGALVSVAQNSKLGMILTDSHGLTLYTFKQDAGDKSACTGACASTWHPLTTNAGTPPTANNLSGKFALITRDDGSKQVTYNGKPLYTYNGDKGAGDANGQGIGGLWFAATP